MYRLGFKFLNITCHTVGKVHALGFAMMLLAASLAPVTAYAETILVDGDATYNIVGDEPIRVLDITSPHLPLDLVHVPGFETRESADRQVASVGGNNYLFVVDAADNALHVVDMNEPYVPAGVSVFRGWAGELGDSVVTDLEVIHARDGTYALIAVGDTVQIVDVTNPKEPILAHHIRDATYEIYALEGASELEQFVSDGRTYVMVASVDAIQVLDVTDLPVPDPVSVIRNGQYGFEGITEISDIETMVSGEKVFALVSGYGTIAVVDITNQSFPVQVALMDERHGLEGIKSNFCMIIRCGAAMEEMYESRGIIDVAVIGSHALVLESGMVRVVDFDDPSSPEILSSVTLPDDIDVFEHISGIELGGRLWALAEGQTIFALDITDLHAPVPAYVQEDITLYHLTGVDTAVIDGRTYGVVTSITNHAVNIIDITDPASPVPVAGIAGSLHGLGGFYGPHDVAITDIGDGTYALIPNIQGNTVLILDITQPAKPVLAASVNGLETLFAPAYVEAVAMGEKTYAVVSSHYAAGIQIIDVTDPYAPEPTIFIANEQYGFTGLDGPLGLDVAAVGDSTYVLVASYYDDAFQIIDITDVHSPVSATVWVDDIDGYGLAGIHGVKGVKIQDSTYAVVTKTHDDSVTIIDISDPYEPVWTARVQGGQDGFEHMSGPKDMDIVSNDKGTFVLVPDYIDGYMNIIDITNPASPVMAGPEALELGSVEDVSVVSTGTGTYAVVTDVFADGIYVVDVTDPSSPEVMSSILSGPDRAWTLLGDEMELLEVNGRAYALLTAYVDDAVRVTDVTDPYKPVPAYVIQDGRDGFDMGRPISVTSGVAGGSTHAMISGFRDGVIQIVDMSDPERPVPVSVIRGGDAGFEGFTGAGNVVMAEIGGAEYAVAAAFNEDAVHVFDISDPARPAMIATARDGQGGFELAGAEDISIVNIGGGTFAVVSSFGDSSIRVIDITNPAAPKQASLVRGGMEGYDFLYHITDVDAITVGDVSLMVAGTFLSDAVVVMDISDPYDPVRLSSLHDHQDGGVHARSPDGRDGSDWRQDVRGSCKRA